MEAQVFCSGYACPNLGVLKCLGCKVRWYCSVECQKRDRRSHKPQCYYVEPAKPREPWQCHTLDANKMCWNASRLSVAKEKTRLLWLLRSDFVALTRALTLYTRTVDDSTLNASMDALRDHSFADEALEAMMPSRLEEGVTGCRQALVLFWAMLLQGECKTWTQVDRALVTLAAMGLYYCDASSEIFFRANNTTSLVSFPFTTGEEYTVQHSPVDGFSAVWTLDRAQQSHNLCYLLCFVALEAQHPDEQPAIVHRALLRVVNKHAFLLQSCLNYYSVAEWLDYESELSVTSRYTLPSESLYKVEPRPRWRRNLNLADVTALARDIDALTGASPDPQCYARLTGLVAESLAPMRLLILRQCY